MIVIPKAVADPPDQCETGQSTREGRRMDFAYGILGQPAVRMHGKMNEQWGQRQTRNILGILLTRPGLAAFPRTPSSPGSGTTTCRETRKKPCTRRCTGCVPPSPTRTFPPPSHGPATATRSTSTRVSWTSPPFGKQCAKHTRRRATMIMKQRMNQPPPRFPYGAMNRCRSSAPNARTIGARTK